VRQILKVPDELSEKMTRLTTIIAHPQTTARAMTMTRRTAHAAHALALLCVIAVLALPTLVVAGGYGRSSLYHELRRTYGFGGDDPDADHSHDDPIEDPTPAEPEVEKPANLLHLSARGDHAELRAQFEKFPDHHDINAPLHPSGLTALKHAIMVGNDTYVKTVIELGADTGKKLFGGRAIHFNAGSCGVRGSVPTLKVLVEHGAANVTEENEHGYQAIHIAARGWKERCVSYVEALLDLDGVDPNARRSTGNQTTPLHEAAHRSSSKMCDVLVNAGADVNAQDADGETPLHKAIRGDHVHAAWGLMQAGADIFIKNKRGVDVEQLAKLMRADYDTLQMFKQHKEKLLKEGKLPAGKHDEL